MSHKLTQELFTVEGNPLVIAPRFEPLFNAIFYREHDRVNVLAPTQDGKSLTIAAAVTPVAASTPERFTILAPSEKKADIIMAHVRELATQHPVIYSQLELDKSDTLDRLKRERSKRHLTFLRGGGIQTLALDARNSKRNLEAAMGFGSKNIMVDEAGLIEDVLWATVMRMLGGDTKKNPRKKILIKVGNPFYRNHFYKSTHSSRYLQIFHNYKESIRDYDNGYYGFKPEFIEEMRDEALFDILYECKFPDEDVIDGDGYRQLITEEQLAAALRKPDEITGRPKMGNDVAAGGDLNARIKRWANYATVISSDRSTDTMTNVTEIESELDKDDQLRPEAVFVDSVGLGKGVVDRLHEQGKPVKGVMAGGTATEKGFANIKAENYWLLRNDIVNGKLALDPEYANQWRQLLWIKYKVNTDKQVAIEPKEKLIRRTGKSPDFAEALMLTYSPETFVGFA
jgi:hypothetical protein